MDELVDFDEIIWHDGQLITIVPEMGEGTSKLAIHLNVYPNDDASSRECIIVECSGVKRCAIVLDFFELLDNQNAGNVAGGYVKRRKRNKLLRISLMDGYIDVTCKSVTVKKH